MNEKIILKETVTTTKPLMEKKPRKKYYKPRKKKETTEDEYDKMKDLHEVVNSEKPFVSEQTGLKIPTKVGKYCIGGYCVHLESKPNCIHRYFMRLFFGWKWTDYSK